MLASKEKGNIIRNTKTMVALSLLITLSIVFGKELSITVGTIRISFENLPILMAGIFFGPVAGAMVGGCADIIGCLVVGYTINPIITFGAVSIGLISGVAYKFCNLKNNTLKLAISTTSAHIIGSMIIKSIGLYVYYHYAIQLLLLRIPLYIAITLVETLILFTLLKNKAFVSQLKKFKQ